MDPIVLTFYAIVCGLLGLVGPRLGAPLSRISIGALVGIAAATGLPYIRQSLGL